MKLKFKVSPVLKDKTHSTQRVMMELTLGLLVLFAYGTTYYGVTKGTEYVTHSLLLLISAVVSGLVYETIYAMIIKKPVKEYLLNSFSWVTSIILVLMLPITTTVYAVVLGNFFALVVAKLLFGGFGQNIFNPAGVGRIVILKAFGAATVADLSTGATPISDIASKAWSVAANSWEPFLETYGGWTGLLTGWHGGSIGETSIVLIVLIGIYLAWRRVIDWLVPVFYVGTVFLLTLVIGLLGGLGVQYALFHVLAGGLMFGAVFMATDPVTNPTHPLGRIIFAIGAGIITVLLRTKASMPGGVVFAIIFMNMLTPLIERSLYGNQRALLKKGLLIITSVFVVGLVMAGWVGSNVEKIEIIADEINAEVVSVDGNKVTVKAPGFNIRETNTFVVEVVDGKVVSIENTEFKDSNPEGLPAIAKSYLEKYVGKGYEDIDSIDAATNATYSSDSVKNATKKALLELKGGN